jgi:hypothetical protein
VAIASLRYASTGWRTAVYAITMAAFMWAAVVAVVDRGRAQAFAIGMVLCMAIYGAAVYLSPVGVERGSRELEPTRGHLPTTKLAAFFYRPTVTTTWRDQRTGVLLPNYDPANAPPGTVAARSTSSTPVPATFMAIAHCWWSLLLGYIGARVSEVVYMRRNSLSQQPLAG